MFNNSELEMIKERMLESKLAIRERMKQLQLQLDAMKVDSRATEDMNYYCSLDHGIKNLEEMQAALTAELKTTNSALMKAKAGILCKRIKHKKIAQRHGL